jgi:hypothetical protein
MSEKLNYSWTLWSPWPNRSKYTFCGVYNCGIVVTRWCWKQLSQPEALPFDPFNSWYEIEMTIAAAEGQRMLSAECCDRDVIGWNRCSRLLKFGTDRSVGNSGSILDVKETKVSVVRLDRALSTKCEEI